MAETTEVADGTILVLEDDAGIAHLEQARLRRAGYAVEVAATADEARRRIERGGVDLMVLDYRLKGASSGLDLHNELRGAGLGVASVLVTGFNDEALLAQALRAGVRDFIPKTPDYLDYLVPTVGRVLNQVRTERQLEMERARRVYEQGARAEAEAGRAALAESESRLRELTEALKDADRRKDEFIAMLAHELRNPLAAINNAVALSRMAADGDAREWSADVIERQVGNLTRLIDDLLDVSRIRTGKLQLRPCRVDAAEVVAHAVESVRPFVEAKRHTLRVAVAPGPHWVDADPTRLEQVVVNLLTNAAKYTDEGGRDRPHRRPRGGRVRRPGPRLGGGDLGRDAPQGLRPVHPGRGLARPGARRARDRPDPGPEPRRDARRERLGGERRPGPRQRVHRPLPGRAGRRRRRR